MIIKWRNQHPICDCYQVECMFCCICNVELWNIKRKSLYLSTLLGISDPAPGGLTPPITPGLTNLRGIQISSRTLKAATRDRMTLSRTNPVQKGNHGRPGVALYRRILDTKAGKANCCFCPWPASLIWTSINGRRKKWIKLINSLWSPLRFITLACFLSFGGFKKKKLGGGVIDNFSN